ncbi:hypothetical protein ASC89_15690 [Devosia sp. Root413D1]|uniref:hypothetical protein n=1 Tax=unclassified Devosia TaxID=196773 RepID=UPI0006F36D31|nr:MULTISPECIES: hypothetical protein [unclassified Devosia]KQU95859.1 hypothetical protein ASC68_16950 [Devosia sp. Root105]KQW78231.1 hypothetical protein ASC89_15690 [Devosia sp. Root413D1]
MIGGAGPRDRLIGIFVLFAMLLATGPTILNFIDLVIHGPTASALSFLFPSSVLYAFWCLAVVLRSAVRAPIGLWEHLILLPLSVAVLIGTASVSWGWFDWLPSGPSFKRDGLRFFELVTTFPWLAIQYIAIMVIGSRVGTRDRI